MFFAFLCSCFLYQTASVVLPHNRRAFVLDGEWGFNLSEPAMSGKIIVPGAWEAQGYGTDAARMRWQVLTGDEAWAQGKLGAYGIYSKKAHPVCAAGERAILIVDGWIHRHAVFKIDGRVVGEHLGYLTPFEVDVTAEAEDGEIDIEITLDGGRNTTLDGLMGCADLDIAYGESLGGWVGLNGHVIVECRPRVFIDLGKGSVMPPHVTHPPVSSSSEGKAMDINVSFSVEATDAQGHQNLWATVTVARVGAQIAEAVSYSLVTTSRNFVAQLRIPSLVPWSLSNPALYNATVSLHPCESCPAMDTVWTKFGVRTLVVDGYKFMLNGRRLYLNGYGDDSIYPLLVSPPRDKAPYAARLERIKKLGFNFARHHSTTLPREYFDATDEAGILLSPEIPCSYPPYYAGATKQVLALYNETWNSRILQLRNHPSIMVWSQCNEGVLNPLVEQFYKTAKEWDPTRLVLAVDGGGAAAEDYESRQFDFSGGGAWGAFEKLAAPSTYYDKCDENGTCSWGAVPDHPVISHETGNYMGFPRLSSLLAEFEATNTTIKPFWLTPTQDKIKSLGLWDEAELWSAASEYLYTLCWKIDIEDLRHNAQLSGYQWWLLQDYWQASDGIFDIFFRAKPGISLEAIQSFNSESVLLQSGLKLAYSSADFMYVIISVSNYGAADITNGTLTLTLRTASGVMMHESVPILPDGVRQGEIAPVFKLNFTLPEIGNTSTPSAAPLRVTLSASLDVAGFTVPTNSWNTTVFPRFKSVNTPSSWTLYVTEPELTQGCGYWNCQTLPLLGASEAFRGVTWNNGVYLARDLSQPLLSAVRRGSVAVIMPENNGLFFPSDSTRFKLAWWLDGRGAGDNNGGVVVYPPMQQILGDMTIDGFPDQTWYWMIEGSHTFLMEDIDPIDPTHDQMEVLIRAIDGFKYSRNKALVFKMKVGKGAIIMCGLRVLEIPTKSPEKAWVLTRLLAHAGDIFVNGSAPAGASDDIQSVLV